LTLLVCALAAQAAVAQQPPAPNSLQRVEVSGRKAAVSPWFRAESQHLVVYSDTSEDEVAQLLDQLEKLDHLLRIYALPLDAGTGPEAKLTLYFHSQPADVRRLHEAPVEEPIGLYASCSAGAQGFVAHLDRIPPLTDAQLDKAALDPTLSAAFEAYARHFLYRHTDIRTPAWFIEGFAQYFSSVRFTGQQMVVGRTPTQVGRYLHFLEQGRRYSLSYEDVLKGRLDGNSRNYGGEAGVRLEFEAKSWLLTHYLLADADRRKRLSQYLGLVGRGLSETAVFTRLFGVAAKDIDNLLWRYGIKGVQAMRVAPDGLPKAQVRLRTLSEATGAALLMSARLKTCPSRPRGEALLQQASALAAQYPADELVRLTLSRAQIDWGEPQQALPLLGKVLAADDTQAEAHHLLGLAHLRLAQASSGDAKRAHLQDAQAALRRALSLNPAAPEAALAALLAAMTASDDPSAPALDTALAAWRGARDIGALAGATAQAQAHAGQGDDAHRMLGVLAQDLRAPDLATWARQWQAKLEAGVSRAALLAELRRTPLPGAAQREWTVDKASAMQAVERGFGLEAADSFIKQQAQQQDALPPAPPPPPAPGR
jgi:tetratricopeptide (TPR) repeat protein